MVDTNIYRRPAFINRPWMRGGLYDKYASKSVLHCDAYVLALDRVQYLVIDWRVGGKRQLAFDCYLIEPDGLTPVWNAGHVWATGKRVFWTRYNHATMRGVHARVLAQVPAMQALSGLTQTTVQAHYVYVKDESCEPLRNEWKPPKPYKKRAKITRLPDIL